MLNHGAAEHLVTILRFSALLCVVVVVVFAQFASFLSAFGPLDDCRDKIRVVSALPFFHGVRLFANGEAWGGDGLRVDADVAMYWSRSIPFRQQYSTPLGFRRQRGRWRCEDCRTIRQGPSWFGTRSSKSARSSSHTLVCQRAALRRVLGVRAYMCVCVCELRCEWRDRTLLASKDRSCTCTPISGCCAISRAAPRVPIGGYCPGRRRRHDRLHGGAPHLWRHPLLLRCPFQRPRYPPARGLGGVGWSGIVCWEMGTRSGVD